jgi:hypothetical protein
MTERELTTGARNSNVKREIMAQGHHASDGDFPGRESSPETPSERGLRYRWDAAERKAKARNLVIVRGRFGPDHGNHLLRIGAGNIGQPITPAEGTSLDVISAFLDQTTPLDLLAAMVAREAAVSLATREPRTSVKPESTKPL